MFQVVVGNASDVSKLAYSKYQLFHGKFQDNFEKVKSVIRTKLSSSSSRYTSLDDNDHDTSEHRNGEKTPNNTEDSDPLFPVNRFLPSNPGSPPRRVQSRSNEGV